MRLISCYIESYGAIKKQTITFDKNLTCVCEQNGYGKTTLASFLETMFYGLETNRANSKGLPTRKHYLPFDGGRFGGNVVFKYDGDTYKIERYFDEKSEAKDSLTVYKNNNVTQYFGTQVSEKLFGIDRQSFERTIFINANEIEIGSTGSINAKLGTIVEGGENNNTDAALKRLDCLAGEYRKSRGDGGLIAAESNEIFKLSQKIGNLKAIKDSLPEKYRKLSACEGRLKTLQKKLDDAQKADLALKDWEQYDALANAAEERGRALARIDEKYPLGLPSPQELKAAREAISAKNTLERQTENLLSPEDGIELERLKNKYRAGVPSEAEISDVTAKTGELAALDAALRAEESGAPSERQSRLRARFDGRVPQKSALEALDGAATEYRAAEKAYAETPDYIIEKSAAAKQKAGGKKYVIPAAIFAVTAAVGAGVMFAALTIGVIVLAAGLIGLAASGFLYLNNKTGAASAETVQRPNPEKAACERAKNNAELKIRQLVAPYGYPTDNNVYFLLESFKNDLAEYGKLLQADRQREERAAATRAKRGALQREIDAFFSEYAIDGGGYGEKLAKLQGELARYNTLAQTRAKLLEQNGAAIKEIEKQHSVILNFCRKYGFDSVGIDACIAEIEGDAASRSRAREDYETYRKKAEIFKAQKGLESRPEKSGGENLRQITQGIEKLNADRSAILSDINDCENEAEKIDALEAEKGRRIQTLEKYKRDYELIRLTRELLKKADMQLKDRYIKPIKDNFIKYANMLERALGEKVTMTADFEIRFERGGAERSEKYLSAGQLGICAFCFRIALIENMYGGEKPFLILDDPFVNLDENHMEKVKQLLKALSKDLQIIYFTCHQSRKV